MSHRQISQGEIDRFRFEAEEVFARHGFIGQVQILRDRLVGLKILGRKIEFSGLLGTRYEFSASMLEFVGRKEPFMEVVHEMPTPAVIYVLGDLWQIYHYNVYRGDA